jgi:hypothetical protein
LVQYIVPGTVHPLDPLIAPAKTWDATEVYPSVLNVMNAKKNSCTCGVIVAKSLRECFCA